MPKNSNIKNDSDWKMRFLDCAVIQTVYKANENEPFLMKLGIKLVKNTTWRLQSREWNI